MHLKIVLVLITTSGLSACSKFKSADANIVDLPSVSLSHSDEKNIQVSNETLPILIVMEMSPVKQNEQYRPVEQNEMSPAFDRAAAEESVKRAYKVILQRDAEVAGLKYYTDFILQGVLDEASLAQALLASDEYFVLSVYLKELNRLPEANGRKHYVELLKNGESRARITLLIADSDEAFVKKLYIKHLYRAPEPAGLSHFMGLLSSGISRATVESRIASSPESTVQAVYREFLERAPESEGLTSWMNELSSGRLDRVSFVAAVKASDEYFVRSTWKKYHADLVPDIHLKQYTSALRDYVPRSGIDEYIKARRTIL